MAGHYLLVGGRGEKEEEGWECFPEVHSMHVLAESLSNLNEIMGLKVHSTHWIIVINQ